MFTALSPKILVIFEIGFFSVIRIAVTSVFFFDLARLKSDSSSVCAAFSGSAVTMRTTPYSPASAMLRA